MDGKNYGRVAVQARVAALGTGSEIHSRDFIERDGVAVAIVDHKIAQIFKSAWCGRYCG